MNQDVGFSFKAKNSSSQKKPRVFFTCHQEDFDLYFGKICRDIFKTCDCVVYYTEDMTADLTSKNNLVDLERMHLFIIPVTYRLLSQPNRAMDHDFRFAMEKHIPVLPVLMEPGIESLYSAPDKFGKLQYLFACKNDVSAISYEEKLKKYLESNLINKDLIKKIQKEFDAYFFLSYRKVDRSYANELMKLIHKNRKLRDIAIWYDEFLSIGEDFEKNITKYLRKSDLFTILITPNILERPNGNPNFVMKNEYPAAQKAGKIILPAEMEPTDTALLKELFEDIPECVDAYNEKELKKRLLNAIKGIALYENDDDPNHNFLIGLAYLGGIDVEVDAKYGIKLITKAAQSGLPEAMKKLCSIYSNGERVLQDYNKALYWAKTLVNYNKNTFGEAHENTIIALCDLSTIYVIMGNYKEAKKTQKRIISLCEMNKKNSSPYMVYGLYSLAVSYISAGNHEEFRQAKELGTKASLLASDILKESNPELAIALKDTQINNLKQLVDSQENALALCTKALGEDHANVIIMQRDLAFYYYMLGSFEKATELLENVYSICREYYGEEHLLTLCVLEAQAVIYSNIGDHVEAKKLFEKVYTFYHKIHADETSVIMYLANTYTALGNYRKATELYQKNYRVCSRQYGDKHPVTVSATFLLAQTYLLSNRPEKAMPLLNKLYLLCNSLLIEGHPISLILLFNIAETYDDFDEDKAIELRKKLYKICLNTKLEDYPEMLGVVLRLLLTNLEHEELPEQSILVLAESVLQGTSNLFGKDHMLNNFISIILASLYLDCGEEKKAQELLDKVEAYCSGSAIERNPTVMGLWIMLAGIYEELENLEKAEEFNEKIYAFLDKIPIKKNPEILQQTLHYLEETYFDSADEDGEKIAKILKKQYELCAAVYGETHPETISALLKMIFSTHQEAESEDEAQLDLAQVNKAYSLSRNISASEYPDILQVWKALAEIYETCDLPNKAIELQEKIFFTCVELYGENDEDAQDVLDDLVCTCEEFGSSRKTANLFEKLYDLCCQGLLKDHLESIKKLHTLALIYYNKASFGRNAMLKKVYYLYDNLSGDDAFDFIEALNELAEECEQFDEYQKEVMILEKVYSLCCKFYGRYDPLTLNAIESLISAYQRFKPEHDLWSDDEEFEESCINELERIVLTGKCSTRQEAIIATENKLQTAKQPERIQLLQKVMHEFCISTDEEFIRILDVLK